MKAFPKPTLQQNGKYTYNVTVTYTLGSNDKASVSETIVVTKLPLPAFGGNPELIVVTRGVGSLPTVPGKSVDILYAFTVDKEQKFEFKASYTYTNAAQENKFLQDKREGTAPK